MRFDEYGRKTYPATLDSTTAKPTLILDEKHKRTFANVDLAYEWANKHGYYIENYIEWMY